MFSPFFLQMIFILISRTLEQRFINISNMFDKNHLRKGPVTDAAIVTRTFVAI